MGTVVGRWAIEAAMQVVCFDFVWMSAYVVEKGRCCLGLRVRVGRMVPRGRSKLQCLHVPLSLLPM